MNFQNKACRKARQYCCAYFWGNYGYSFRIIMGKTGKGYGEDMLEKEKPRKMNLFTPFTGLKIELYSNRKAIVEGSCGILEYSEEKIVIKTKKEWNLCFEGKCLRICCLDRESLVVECFFSSVSYVR